ncbi:hypothetical protein DVH24_030547 [Malus domestica]|uniref:Isopenicillin N synthase-like Fe(2+) 2OG dioxygenase domain-containing protein n=1 Tax=Malus domestica TaxID=3750 RepID=A0A498JY97_MALDO|nr:hypothetical protein DVH24_030547 [Malus domestica]
MVATKTNYDQKSEVKAFDDTKEGVKGLVDAGITEVPRIFHQPLESDIGDRGRFKSIRHKVLANCDGPRISVASFFYTGMLPLTKLYGPIKELLDNHPTYRETTVRDFFVYYNKKGLDDTSGLSDLEL